VNRFDDPNVMSTTFGPFDAITHIADY